MTTFDKWMLAIRPKTLPAAASPVFIGAAIAYSSGQFHLGAALAAVFGALMIQIGTNLVNDVVDFYRGADTEARLGPTRVTHTGLLSPRRVWLGVMVSFGLAALAGVYLTVLAGWPVVAIGLTSILAGVAYTAGPMPLAYNGLGDLFVMIFFGFAAVCGTAYVTARELPPSAWWASAAAGALTVNILVVNNIRDIETDRQAKRKNIPVVFGRKAAEWEFGLMLALACAAPVMLAVGKLTSPWVLLALLSAPKGLKLLNILRGGLQGPPLNPILGETAQMLLLYSLLFSIGIVLPVWLKVF
ncbi:1,4-dihydroxy-2-naphthoate polyprenyltransferase [Chloroflexota bacterium]